MEDQHPKQHKFSKIEQRALRFGVLPLDHDGYLHIAEDRVNWEIAQMAYQARVIAGMGREDLGWSINESAETIMEVEFHSYEGSNFSVLCKIAHFFGYDVRIKLVPMNVGKED